MQCSETVSTLSVVCLEAGEIPPIRLFLFWRMRLCTRGIQLNALLLCSRCEPVFVRRFEIQTSRICACRLHVCEHKDFTYVCMQIAVCVRADLMYACLQTARVCALRLHICDLTCMCMQTYVCVHADFTCVCMQTSRVCACTSHTQRLKKMRKCMCKKSHTCTDQGFHHFLSRFPSLSLLHSAPFSFTLFISLLFLSSHLSLSLFLSDSAFLQLHNIFFVGACSVGLSLIILGFVMDSIGPKLVRLAGLIIFSIGACLFAFSDSRTFDVYAPAMGLIGVGGGAVRISAFVIAEHFEGSFGTVHTLLNAVSACLSCVMVCRSAHLS